MAVHGIRSVAPAAPVPAHGLLRGVRVRLASLHFDARLAAGEDPRADAGLARRSRQLVSSRTRRKVAAALERVSSQRPGRVGVSAAIPVDARAVEIDRPALRQLAAALRSSEPVRAQGVVLVPDRVLNQQVEGR